MCISTISTWEGKTLTPLMISMSSVLPVTLSMRTWVRPQGQGPSISLDMSRVR